MNKVKLALVAIAGVLLSSCGGKTEVDFSIVPVKGSGGNYQYIDVAQKGKIVINPQFGNANAFRDGLALVSTSGRDGKYGYIDKNGKFAIPPVYNVAQNFGEGLAWVQMEKQPPILVDKKGKMLLQIDSLISASPFNDGIALISVYTNGEEVFLFIDKKGKEAATTVKGETVMLITDGVYASKNADDKWGFRNKKGDIIVNHQFDDAEPFIDGMAVVKSGGKYGVINKKGEYLINPQYERLIYDSDGLFKVEISDKWGWVNKKGEIIINPQFESGNNGMTLFLKTKLAPARMSKKWAYIDKKGQIIINPQFKNAAPFNGEYALIENDDGKIGFINSKGDFVIHPMYDGLDEDYIRAIMQKVYGFPIGRAEKFQSYDRLEEKKKAFNEAKAEAAKAEAEKQKKAEADALAVLVESVASNPELATAELEKEAKKWLEGPNYKASSDNPLFNFKRVKKENDMGEDNIWTATSKVQIGDCPAKSVWRMTLSCGDYCSGWSDVSAKCKSITPKTITGYKYSDSGDM